VGNEKPKDEKKYKSKSAEDHFELKYRLAQRGIILPSDNVLKDQLRRRKYMMPNDDSNRVSLEPKEKIRNRGEKSPDRLDVVVMLSSEMPPVEFGVSPVEERTVGGACPPLSACFEPVADNSTGRWGSNLFEQ